MSNMEESVISTSKLYLIINKIQLFWFISNQVYMFRGMFSPIIRNCNYSFWYCPPMLLLAVNVYWVEPTLKSVPLKTLTLKSVPPKKLTFKSVPPKTLTLKSVPPKTLTLKSFPPKTQHRPAATSVDDTRSCNYINMLLMMDENIARNM
jgi:hypothetical protein